MQATAEQKKMKASAQSAAVPKDKEESPIKEENQIEGENLLNEKK